MTRFFNTCLLSILIILSSCQGLVKPSRNHQHFNFPITSLPTSWKPYMLYDFNTQITLNQLYEGLVSIDQNTYQIVPQIAKEFSYSPDFLNFTFTLRNNVYFHGHLDSKTKNNKKLTYQDVIKTFEFICLQEKSTAYENVVKRILGAEKFKEGKTDHIEGITYEDGKINIELSNPDPLFLQKLSQSSCGILSSDWMNQPKDEIPHGTGPFYVSEYNKHHILLKRNERYYLKDNNNQSLPYLESVQLKIYHNKKQRIKEFLEGDLDFLYAMNVKTLDTIFQTHKNDFNSYPPRMVYSSHPLLSSSIILFNLEKPIFQTKSIRRLFNYAINRNEIYKEILHRRTEQSNIPFGLIPPIKDYYNQADIDKLNKNSLNYNPSKIQQNLGLINDFLLDTLTLNIANTPERIAIGKNVKKQLQQELGITIQLQILSPKDLFQSIEKLDADLFLVSLSSEFSSPLSMMNHFYAGGKRTESNAISSINFTNYHNWYFDQFFEKASRQSKPSQQSTTLQLAENELLSDPPFIVLHYDHDHYIFYNYVHGLTGNLTNSFYFRDIYLK